MLRVKKTTKYKLAMSIQTRQDGTCPACNREHRMPQLKDNRKQSRLRIWRVWQSTSGTSLTLHMPVYIVICPLRVVTCTRAQSTTQAPLKTTLAPQKQQDTHERKGEQRTKTNLQNSPLCFRPKYARVMQDSHVHSLQAREHTCKRHMYVPSRSHTGTCTLCWLLTFAWHLCPL